MKLSSYLTVSLECELAKLYDEKNIEQLVPSKVHSTKEMIGFLVRYSSRGHAPVLLNWCFVPN